MVQTIGVCRFHSERSRPGLCYVDLLDAQSPISPDLLLQALVGMGVATFRRPIDPNILPNTCAVACPFYS